LNTLKKDIFVLESDFENNRILIEDFRFYQHSMVEYFLEIMVNYISTMNKKQISFDRIESEETVCYSGLSNNELIKYIVFVKINGVVKEFFQVFIPKLVYDNFYFLNGNYYVPLFYIIDKPIVIKENSVNLSSLFSSITFNFSSGICIFTGRNIDLNTFVSLFLFNDTSDESIEIGNNITINNNEDVIVGYFNSVFNNEFKSINEIKDHIEKLFFDEYTRGLYSCCYEGDILINNLSDVIKIALTMYFSGKVFNFIDLKNKRISLIELLLAPLFKKVANVTYQVNKGYLIDKIVIDQYIITKNFHKSEGKTASKQKANSFKSFSGLSGKTLYDLVNLYSSLLVHKCSFVKPGMKSPPKSVANTHSSHFGKLCPITVSNDRPGEMLSIVPEIYVDVYGQFLDI